MDEMKGQRQFQWKTLHKHIELCELANGMTRNASQLSARECRLAMEKLLSKNIGVALQHPPRGNRENPCRHLARPSPQPPEHLSAGQRVLWTFTILYRYITRLL